MPSNLATNLINSRIRFRELFHCYGYAAKSRVMSDCNIAGFLIKRKMSFEFLINLRSKKKAKNDNKKIKNFAVFYGYVSKFVTSININYGLV
jgi:hypothetical protein